MSEMFCHLRKIAGRANHFRCLFGRFYNTSCQSIVVLNPGSTSLKCSVFNVCDLALEAAVPPYFHEEIELTKDNKDKEIENFFDKAFDEFGDIRAFGLRAVHGGPHFKETMLATNSVVETLENLIHLAPLHLPPLLSTLKQVCSMFPVIPCYLAFDTAFFADLPEHVKFYPLPYEMAENGVIKYGFHGLNHRYCCEKISLMLEKIPGRLITCHLGGGASVSAIKDGLCIDTSMGYTALDGIMMTTRTGSLDPSIVLQMVDDSNGNIDEVERILNQRSGILGVSGLKNMAEAADQRDVNPRAKLACDMFNDRLCKTIGSYVAVLGGIDGLIFSGGIGENSTYVREEVVKRLEFLGVMLDEESNNVATKEDRIISTSSSSATVAVIHANEELVIAQDIRQMFLQSFYV